MNAMKNPLYALAHNEQSADKEARKRDVAAAGLSPLPLPSAPPAPMKDYREATIQIRLPSGELIRNTFASNAALSEVRSWLKQTKPELVPFLLLQPFPRKVMTDEDMMKSLSFHGLVPSGSLVVTRAH